jgi:ATP-dependent 26S proteasome regulatory subunit
MMIIWFKLNWNHVTLITDPKISYEDYTAYASLEFFYKLGIPSDSYITVLAYNEEMKEDEWCIHVVKIRLSDEMLKDDCIKMTQLLYMNLTNLGKNPIVFCRPLGVDYVNNDVAEVDTINLPRIKKLNLYTIKTLKRSENQAQAISNFYKSLKEPVPLKVNDLIYVPKYDIFKVKSIVFEDDPNERLGLRASNLGGQGKISVSSIEVGPLSYSKYPCYMLDPNYGCEIDIGTTRISSVIPDLNHMMDYPFDILKGYEYEFLSELREYFQSNSNQIFELVIVETAKRNQMDSILQGLAFNLNMVYDQESALDYCSVSGIKSLFETVASSVAPGILHIRHFQYLNLILEQSSTGQPSKKDKDSIEIRLSNVLKESISNLEQILSKKGDKLYIFIETQRTNDVFAEVRQSCTKIINIPNPESDTDITELVTRKELLMNCNDTGAYSAFIPDMIKPLKKRSIDEIWAIMKKWIYQFNSKIDWKDGVGIEEQYLSTATEIWKQVDDLQKSLGDSPLKVPEVKWRDVGGLGLAKHDILQTIELPLKNPGLFKNGLIQRGGLLLYGPPGTGKTLLAKAIATEWELNFMSVKGPEILNMYVGESEKNIREIFEKARANSPWVIFFDELDSLAPARGNGSDSNQVMDRIVAQLLTEIDGVNSKGQVFVVGATNRPDLLDPALMRPGRFDKKIYLGIAQEPDERIKIMKAQTRKFTLDPEVDFNEIEKHVPSNFTGADFSGLTNDAYMQAAQRWIDDIENEVAQLKTDNGYFTIPEEIKEKYEKVIISEEDFIKAAKLATPSLTLADIQSYNSIRDQNN